MQIHRRLSFLALLFFITSPLQAVTIEGVDIPDTLSPASGTAPLVLNGAGIRQKFIFDIYIGALYLPVKNSHAEQILASHSAKIVFMHFVYDHIEKQKIRQGWTEGFENNLSEDEFNRLQPSITAFNAFFPDINKGDEVRINLLASGETQVYFNNTLSGAIREPGFQHALLSLWLGDDPADSDLKAAMLGTAE